jgi:hypothetical protein
MVGYFARSISGSSDCQTLTKEKKMVLVQLDFKDTGSFAQRRPNAVQIKFLHNF